MNSELLILMVEAMAIYCLVLGSHALRNRFGLAHFYALLGGLTAMMSWVTDAGVSVHVPGITFMVGSTVFYTSLLLGVFVIYVFDGPHATRIAISTIASVSVLVPIIALVLHFQMRLTGITEFSLPMPSLRINAASVVTTIVDFVFLAMVWEFLGKAKHGLGIGLRAFGTLLGVLWLDVILFGTGAFLGTPGYLSIMKGSFISRLVIATFAWPFLYLYLSRQNRRADIQIQNRPVLAILKEVAAARGELRLARQENDRRRESEQKMEALLDAIPSPVFHKDCEGRYQGCNHAFEALLGIPRDQIVGKTTYEVAPRDIADTYKAKDDELFAHPGRQVYEWKVTTKSGDVREVIFHKATFEDSHGKVAGLIGVIQDITERKQSEDALRKSEGRFRALFEGAAEGILVADQESRTFLYANPAICDMLGYTTEELTGMAVQNIHPTESQPAVFAAFEAQARGEMRQAPPLPCLCKDGSVILVDINTALVEFSDHTRLVGFFRDITERERMKEQQQATEAQLHEGQRMASLGTLARGMGHEINNPIMGIMNYAQLILDGLGEDSPVSEYAAEIGVESARVTAVVRRVLEFAEQKVEHSSLARPADLVQVALALLQESLSKASIAVEIDVPEDLQIHCRSNQLQQVLIDLLINAQETLNEKYPESDADKKILVTASLIDAATGGRRPPGEDMEGSESRRRDETMRRLHLTVEDHGSGIASDVREHIFDPFFSTKDRTKHSGLGLSTSLGLVKYHSGTLTVESEVGQWTRFCIEVPIKQG